MSRIQCKVFIDVMSSSDDAHLINTIGIQFHVRYDDMEWCADRFIPSHEKQGSCKGVMTTSTSIAWITSTNEIVYTLGLVQQLICFQHSVHIWALSYWFYFMNIFKIIKKTCILRQNISKLNCHHVYDRVMTSWIWYWPSAKMIESCC